MKRTALFDEHVSLGAKLIDFAGWEMPVQYTSLKEEHQAVREHAGMFDVSHMGEVLVSGEAAEQFIQYLVTNDVTTLANRQIMYALMCYKDGGVVDDLLVYKEDETHYFLVVNASNIEKDFDWMKEVASNFDVTLKNVSDDFSEIAVQGPMAEKALQKLTDFDLSTLGFFYFDDFSVGGHDVRVSRTGYTGEDGFEIYGSDLAIQSIWRELLALEVTPCGLGCRDTLRFEATLPLYGQEIDKDITPLEAGLGFFVKLDTDFVGKEALLKQKEAGLKRKLVGFRLLGKGIPRHGYDVLKDGKRIGVVTTGYISPTIDLPIGLALVDVAYAGMGETFDIQIRKKTVEAEVISKKFLEKNYKK